MAKYKKDMKKIWWSAKYNSWIVVAAGSFALNNKFYKNKTLVKITNTSAKSSDVIDRLLNKYLSRGRKDWWILNLKKIYSNASNG